MSSAVRTWHRWPTWMPLGTALPDEVWAARHRWVMSVLVVQAVAMVPFAVAMGYSLAHGFLEAAGPAAMAALAALARLPKAARASLAAVGLMVESAIAVHLSGGVIEAHFHFFVMVPIVALYESWVPFGLAVGFVLFQHGLVGTVNSSAVYNHESAHDHPWWWAGVHAVLFGSACLGALVNWRLHEQARQVMSQLAETTERDALTGLPNRVGLKRSGQEVIARDTTVSLLMIDLDGFKEANDTLGHAGGDCLLALVADRFRAALCDGDVLGRLGGDEFVVVLAGQRAEGAQAVADRLRRTLAGSFSVHGRSVAVACSVGISTWSPAQMAGPPSESAAAIMTELLRQADVAMYVAKRSRRGAVIYEIEQDHEGTSPAKPSLVTSTGPSRRTSSSSTSSRRSGSAAANPSGFEPSLVVEEVLQHHELVSPGLGHGNPAGLQEPDEDGSRHSEEVGGLLGGEAGVVGCHSDAHP